MTENLLNYYNSYQTLYYLAPAAHDLPRRNEYAKDVQRKLTELDSTKFHLKYQLFENADQNSIVTHGLLLAIEYLFSFYNLFENKTENW
ncbi:hypothetical protein ACEN2P_03575 [Pedobacter psychrotolerans]|uniref:hypothetical protein n=1 Tax=Pedobacter psychrotolerans TaxID=1843235 RepID=UPI003F9C0C2B